MQSFLPGGITPSTASSKTGVVPKPPPEVFSMSDPFLTAGKSLASPMLNMGGTGALQLKPPTTPTISALGPQLNMGGTGALQFKPPVQKKKPAYKPPNLGGGSIYK